MSFNFQEDATDYVDLGNLASAKFSRDDDWACLVFFRIESSSGDDRTFISKWQGSSHFMLRTDLQAAPSNIEVFKNQNTPNISGSDSVALDTWYLVAISNAGGTTATLTMWLVGMDGTFIDDGLTNDYSFADAGINDVINVGRREAGADPMHGDINYVCYLQQQISKKFVTSYLHQPYKTAQTVISNVSFFFSLGHDGVTAVDLSGNSVTGTVNGSPTVGNNPPIGPLFGFDWRGSPVSAVAGAADLRQSLMVF